MARDVGSIDEESFKGIVLRFTNEPISCSTERRVWFKREWYDWECDGLRRKLFRRLKGLRNACFATSELTGSYHAVNRIYRK